MSLRFGRVFELRVLFQSVKDKHPNVFSKSRDNVYYLKPEKSFVKARRTFQKYRWLSYIPFNKSYAKARRKIRKIMEELKKFGLRMELRKDGSAKLFYNQYIHNHKYQRVTVGHWKQLGNFIYVREENRFGNNVSAIRCEVVPKFLRCKFPNRSYFLYFSSWR